MNYFLEKVPKVSICMITYNHEKYLKQAIEGVLMQQVNFPFELVIGDDCSLDNSRAICLEYKNKYPDIIKLRLPGKNLGMMPNFIENLRACSGAYIALCEGDDFWTSPDKLQKQVDFLENHPEYIGAFHETQVLYSDGTSGRIYGKEANEDFFLEDSFAKLSPFHTSSVLFKNEAIDFIPDWFFTVLSGDMALFSIISSYGPLRKIPGVMSVYRKHDEGITSKINTLVTYHKRRIELMKCLNKFHGCKYSIEANKVISYHKNQLPKTWNSILANKLKEGVNRIKRGIKVL